MKAGISLLLQSTSTAASELISGGARDWRAGTDMVQFTSRRLLSEMDIVQQEKRELRLLDEQVQLSQVVECQPPPIG